MLNFDAPTANKLCYLGTFNSSTGMVAVTWAVINKAHKSATFKNAIPERLYFPIYFEGEKLKTFDDPFIIRMDSADKKGYRIEKIIEKDGTVLDSVFLLRKFPSKPKMLKVAENLVGTVIVGSQDRKFEKRDTLAIIKTPPAPYFQDIDLNNTKGYQYYLVEAPKANRQMNISEIAFIAEKKEGYTNIMAAPALPSLSTSDKTDTQYVAVIDAPEEEVRKRAEYDGSVLTAPGAYPSISLRLKQPQVIKKLRFAPLNEDNGINIGDNYELFEWNKYSWQSLGEVYAEYNHLLYKNLKTHKMYWLRNKTKGREELPFTLDAKGKQIFIYPY